MLRSIPLFLVALFAAISSCSELSNSDETDLKKTDREKLDVARRSNLSCMSGRNSNHKKLESTELVGDARAWNNSILRVYFMDGDPKGYANVLKVANRWSKYANVRFVETKTIIGSHIRVSFLGEGYKSEIGTDANQYPNDWTMVLQDIDVTPLGDVFDSYVLHEFGHALGFTHEHQRSSANIPWNKPKVYAHHLKYDKWDKDEVDFQVFRLIPDQNNLKNSPFDSLSIMMYEVLDSLTHGSYAVQWNHKLSRTDKAAVKNFYP